MYMEYKYTENMETALYKEYFTNKVLTELERNHGINRNTVMDEDLEYMYGQGWRCNASFGELYNILKPGINQVDNFWRTYFSTIVLPTFCWMERCIFCKRSYDAEIVFIHPPRREYMYNGIFLDKIFDKNQHTYCDECRRDIRD